MGNKEQWSVDLPNPLVICCNPRTGSGLLCDLIVNTGFFGTRTRAHEVLNPNRSDNASTIAWDRQKLDIYLQRQLDTHGWFKIHWKQLCFLTANARRSRKYRRLAPSQVGKWFPESTRFIFLYREDKLAQSVSHLKALMTREWGRRSSELDQESAAFDHKVSLFQICYHIEDAKIVDDRWCHFFLQNDLKPLVLTYDQLVQDPINTVEDILDHLGMQVTGDLIVKAARVKMADEINADLIRKYKRSSRSIRWIFHRLARTYIRCKYFIRKSY